jgi:RNA polymerase sigma-70 factor (ECF subfamily)
MPDWRAIIERDGPAVWRTAYRLLGNHADADECFQEAFVAALEVSRREEVRNWRGLLVHLAAVRAVDWLRRRHRHGRHEPVRDRDRVLSPEPSPPQGALDAEVCEALRAALASLPPTQAEVFCLRCLEGFSYHEIARRLTISIVSVGVLLHRARKRLREQLQEFAEERRTGGVYSAGKSTERGEPEELP